MKMETPDFLKKVGIDNFDDIEKSCKKLNLDEPIENQKLKDSAMEWLGRENFENITKDIDKNIQELKRQSIDVALAQDQWDDTRGDFSSKEKDQISKKIIEKETVKENLINPNSFNKN